MGDSPLKAALAANPQARRRAGRRTRLPRMLPPDAVQRKYERELLAVLRGTFEAMEPEIKRMARPDERQDAFDPGGVARMLARGRASFERLSAPAKDRVEAFAEEIARHNRQQMKRVLEAAIRVDLFGGDDDLSGLVDEFSRENVRLIESIGAEFFGQIEEVTQAGVREGRRPEAIARDIEERYGVSRSRAKLIARDQVAKLNGDITKARQEELGITKYVWRTSQDERVREEHAELDGQEFSWSDPPAVGHPGQDFQCRCWADPVIDVDTL
jgi:SPP1 gp7 family putative phage head morphogenesis protein